MTIRTTAAARVSRGALLALVVFLLGVGLIAGSSTKAEAQAGPIVVESRSDTLTTPPPATLGEYPVTPFAPDERPLFQDVSEVPAPTGGNIEFSEPASHRRVLEGWFANWGHGYLGDVYFAENGALTQTITLPENTRAFYLHAQPNDYATFNITATAEDGTTSGPVPVTTTAPDGTGSAGYFGFYTTDGSSLEAITVEVASGASGFAVGEFGIYIGEAIGEEPPAPDPEPDPQPDPNACTITGTPGNDILRGTNGRDVICGLGGNDQIRGLGANDLIRGGAGNDRIFGGDGNDRIEGASGNDALYGEGGNDTLIGSAGNDRLKGGSGRDSLNGGGGKNQLIQ